MDLQEKDSVPLTIHFSKTYPGSATAVRVTNVSKS